MMPISMPQWQEISVVAGRMFESERGLSMLPDHRETPAANSTPEIHAITRRALLSSGMAIAGGLLVGIDFGRALAGAPGPGNVSMNAFIHVATDGQITMTMPAVEMGQGVYTSQAMCIAEELDVGLEDRKS